MGHWRCPGRLFRESDIDISSFLQKNGLDQTFFVPRWLEHNVPQRCRSWRIYDWFTEGLDTPAVDRRG
jgi:hypothetical protein